MFEKEAKERAKDFTNNKERQVAYECGFLDGADRMRGEMQKQCLALQSDMDKTIEQNMALKSFIEKMKCCTNCEFLFRDGNCYYDKECKNKDHWKLMR